MMKRGNVSLCRRGPVLAILMLMAAVGSAAELTEAGKNLLAEQADAVITVSATVQLGPDADTGSEIFAEGACPVVSPEGLTVVPLSLIDPAQEVKRLGGFQMAMMMGDMSSKVNTLNLIVGQEEPIEAEVVLRDPDLSVAIVRPKAAPAEPMAFIDLKDAAEPELLETVLTLSRMGKVGRREPCVVSGEIQAILETPRKYFVTHGGFLGLGTPLFNVDGQVLGVMTLRTAPGGLVDAQNGVLTGSLAHMGALTAILPAADLRELVATAEQNAAEAATEDAVTTP